MSLAKLPQHYKNTLRYFGRHHHRTIEETQKELKLGVMSILYKACIIVKFFLPGMKECNTAAFVENIFLDLGTLELFINCFI